MAGDTRRFTSTGPNANGQGPRKKSDNGLWIAIIVLFCLGLWPIALALMAYMWLTGDKNKRPEDKVSQAQRRMDSTINEALRRVSQVGTETGNRTAGQAVDRSETPPQPQTSQLQQAAAATSGGPRVRQAAPVKKKPQEVRQVHRQPDQKSPWRRRQQSADHRGCPDHPEHLDPLRAFG